jgi:hypothetical protein
LSINELIFIEMFYLVIHVVVRQSAIRYHVIHSIMHTPVLYYPEIRSTRVQDPYNAAIPQPFPLLVTRIAFYVVPHPLKLVCFHPSPCRLFYLDTRLLQFSHPLLKSAHQLLK